MMLPIPLSLLIFDFYYLFGSLLAIIMALDQYLVKERKLINKILCLFFICNFIWLLYVGIRDPLILHKHTFLANALEFLSVITCSLACGLFFLFFKSAINDDYKIDLQVLRHFIIPFLLISISIGSLIVRFDELGATALYYFAFKFNKLIWISIDILYLGYLLYFLYETGSLFFTCQPENKYYIITLLILLALMLLSVFMDLFLSISLVPVLLVLVQIIGYRYPKILKIIQFEKKQRRYVKSKLQSINIEDKMTMLDRLMSEEKIFTQEDITLKVVSDLLRISPQQLSELLNDRFGNNFTTFINTYRIEMSKQLLIERPDLSVLEIGFESGFNSSSSFYRSFKQILGISPGTYRKQNSQ